MSETDLKDRRREWVALLRSGDYEQGQSLLCRLPIEWVDGDVKPHKEDSEHCCIGVWCANRLGDEFYKLDTTLIFEEKSEIELDRAQNYDLWQEELEVTEKMKNHLMAMNDGRRVTYDSRGVLWQHVEPNDSVNVHRATTLNRDFEFIARFLEIAWGL